MAYVLRTPFILAASLSVLVPDVALARREPGSADAPAAAPQPVAPAATAPSAVAPTAATPTAVPPIAPASSAAAPVAAAPVAAAPVAAAPVVSAPAPACVLPTAMQTAPQPLHPSVPTQKRANGLIAGGAGLFLTAYLYTSILGSIAIDKGKKGTTNSAGIRVPDDERVAFGRRLMIPVVGPFLALGKTDSAMKRWGASFSGLAQVAGVGLIVAGLVAKSRINRARRFGWTAGASHGGGSVMVYGRF
jgi:hypothetical protein